MPIAQYRHNYLQDYSGLCKWKPSEKNSHDVDFAEVRETRNQRERFSAWRMKKKGSSKIQVLRGRSSHSLDLLGIPVILPNLNSTQDWKSIAHSLLNRGIIIWHAKVLVEKKRTLTLMYIKENVSFYNPFAPWEPRHSWILDSTPWMPDCRYWIPVFVSGTWILDSNR